jgi:hypothetical protein
MTETGRLRLLSIAFLLLAASAAEAQSPHGVRRVSIVFEGTWDPALVTDIESDLASGHALLGVPSGSEGESLVRIVFATTADPNVRRITAVNRLTLRELSRDVSLEGEPLDSYGVVLAAAADELVSATWPDDMQLPEATPPPPPPAPVVIPEPVPEVTLRRAIGLFPMVALYGSGQVHFGADIRFGHLPIDAFGWAIRGSYGEALPVETSRGTVRTHALTLGLEVFARLLTHARAVRLDLLAQVRASAVHLSSPAPDAEQSKLWGYGVYARAGARLLFAPAASLRPACEATLGAPLRRVVALEDLRTITGVYGIEGVLSCGAEWAW